MENIRKIVTSPTNRKLLCDKFGVTKGTVSNALNFKTNSEEARKIRSYAANELNSPLLILTKNYEV